MLWPMDLTRSVTVSGVRMGMKLMSFCWQSGRQSTAGRGPSELPPWTGMALRRENGECRTGGMKYIL